MIFKKNSFGLKSVMLGLKYLIYFNSQNDLDMQDIDLHQKHFIVHRNRCRCYSNTQLKINVVYEVNLQHFHFDFPQRPFFGGSSKEEGWSKYKCAKWKWLKKCSNFYFFSFNFQLLTSCTGETLRRLEWCLVPAYSCYFH